MLFVLLLTSLPFGSRKTTGQEGLTDTMPSLPGSESFLRMHTQEKTILHNIHSEVLVEGGEGSVSKVPPT